MTRAFLSLPTTWLGAFVLLQIPVAFYVVEKQDFDFGSSTISFAHIASQFRYDMLSVPMILWVFAAFSLFVWSMRSAKRIYANFQVAAAHPAKSGQPVFLGILLLVIAVIHAVIIDWAVVIATPDYETLKIPSEVGFAGATAPLHQLVRLWALIAILGFAYRNTRFALSCVFLLAFLYFELILLTQNTRFAALIPALGGLVCIQNNRKRAGFLLFLLAFLAAGKVLTGRDSANAQGLVAFWGDILDLDLGILLDALQILIITFSSGLLNFAVATDLFAKYTFEYKILSFSPLPSAIDGFSSCCQHMQYRIHEFTPFSAISEAAKFGFGYVFLLVSIYVTAIGRANTLASRYTDLRRPVMYFYFLAIAVGFQYPIRTSIKLLTAALLIDLVVCTLFRINWRTLPALRSVNTR